MSNYDFDDGNKKARHYGQCSQLLIIYRIFPFASSGSHFNAADSSFATQSGGFLDDSRLSTSTWADPVSAAALINGAGSVGNGAPTPRPGIAPSASFSSAASQLQQHQQQQMTASAGPQMMSASMSFTLPNSSKSVSKSLSSQALAGKSAGFSRGFSTGSLGIGLLSSA